MFRQIIERTHLAIREIGLDSLDTSLEDSSRTLAKASLIPCNWATPKTELDKIDTLTIILS